MIANLLLKLAEIVLPILIQNIFKAEEEHTAPRSGNTKRDVVHKAIIKMILDNNISFNNSLLGDFIDAQVQVLKDNNTSWTLGYIIINKIIKSIIDQEKENAGSADKLKNVISQVLSCPSISAELPSKLTPSIGAEFPDLESFITDQVYLFNEFGIFLKKS